MQITVTKAAYEDLPEIAALYEELLGERQPLRLIEQNFAQIDQNEQYCVLVAKDENQTVLGTAMCIACFSWTECCRSFLVIENVVVSDRCRGMGIGKQLFSEIDRIAEENGYSYAILVSSAFRKSAHRFYEAVGYTESVKGFRKVYIHS